MLTSRELKELCEQPESSILDFKKQFYNFENVKDDKATASFIKDVCSMINTVRTKPAYIIFGVEANPGNPIVYNGITHITDEAILQDKIKGKIHPRPEFSYYTLFINNTQLGILKFPVRKYSNPVSPVLKMKGLEPGKFYYRQGSSNTEALGLEVIRIYEWL